MKHSRALILLCFAIAAILAGCTVEHEQISATSPPAAVATAPPPTVTTTVEPSASPLPPTPTAAPSQTPSPTPGIQLPDDLLFEQQTADCQLPCWHGLRVGESGSAEIQETIDTVFNMSGRDLISAEEIESNRVFENLPNLGLAIWGKTISQDPIQNFWMDIWIREDDYVLQGIEFHLQNEQYTSTTTLERIIRELGRPDHLLVNMADEGLIDYASATIMPIYDRGIAFVIIMYVPVINREDTVLTIEYCTDAPYPRSPDSPEYLSYRTKVYLVAPFENLATLDTLQQHLIGDETRGLVPIQNIFNVNVEQLYSRIEANQTVCLQGQRVINCNTGVGE